MRNELLLFIEILPGAWGIRDHVIGFVDAGPKKKISRIGEAVIQAEHPRVFPAHLCADPNELVNARIACSDLPLRVGVDNRSERGRLRQHLRSKGGAGYITD
jgi:hypothetical protein